ncbi:uncharacterized protein LOC123671161 [Harmonia axyridis]|uniref:uncharacterized protein LOC123671161 n=1 Tax=Harmonia axyridis TaxID=115357 RepID=UPI001E279D57|nr:uncharacterized protein LOC123671161 [Harmonia axyridis]
MANNNIRYPLHLYSKEYKFFAFRKLNKKMKQSLISIRNDFKRNSATIKSKDNIKSVVREIIPMHFFGCRKNKKLFVQIVDRILNHRLREFVHISLLCKDFERKFEWSDNIEKEDDFLEILRDVNLYLLEKCIKPFIKRHFFPVFNGKSYRTDLVLKCEWQCFQNKVFDELVSKKHVKLKDKYADELPRGALRILPKENCDSLSYRPIICYFRKNESVESFQYIKQIKNKLKLYLKEKRVNPSLHKSWAEFVEKSGFQMIYGIKVDVKDSFGSININKLCWLIEAIPRRVLTDEDKNNIINRVKKQYISFKRHNAKRRIILRWCHGLLQGDRLSSLLCDLYYLFLIDQNLLKNCMIGTFFFHRFVDDYIFCSTKRENVENFVSILTQSHVLNEDKIFSNLFNSMNVELPYCGYTFNLCTKEVSIGFSKKKLILRDKLKLWNDNLYSSPGTYLTNVMKFSSASFYFSKVIFSTHYNNEETILKIYFQSMIYLAMKFHCAFMELKNYHKEFCSNQSNLSDRIIRIIKKYSEKTMLIIKNSKGSLFHGDINIEILLAIGVRGFILMFQNYSGIYKGIVRLLKKKIFMKITFFGDLNISFFSKIPSNMII